jgi:hypothetical protein
MLANIEHAIVPINGIRTIGKLHLVSQPMACFDRGQMAGFRAGEHTVETELVVAEL